jgi:hypothetical protein
MTTDKRTVTTDALETLGMIIDNTQKRDAIHLAVEPCKAAEKLYAGEHVGLTEQEASKNADKLLGIVDPFLDKPVNPGEYFWLVVYPRQITSLRHVWTHPNFPESELPEVKNNIQDEKAISEKWIADYAHSLGLTYQRLMDGAADYLENGNYLYCGDYDEGTNNEFWSNYNIVTGINVPYDENFFTCSC